MIFKLFTPLLLLLAFTSCTDFMRGKAAQETTIEIKQESISCLKNIPLDFQKFLRSESSESEINAVFACLDETLAQFESRVEGRIEANAFNAEELFEIFDRFIEDSDVSRAAVEDLLILKRALLGGEEQKITKPEIAALRDFLKLIKVEVQNLRPHARILSFASTQIPFSLISIRDAFAQLNLSLKNLMGASRLNHAAYSYDDFRRLVVNLNIFEGENPELLALADKVNGLLTGGQGAMNTEDQLTYVDNVTELLRLYAVYDQGHVSFSLSTPEKLAILIEFTRDSLSLLSHTLQFKKTNLIKAETIDPLISEVFRSDSLALPLTEETVLGFYKMILVRVFESGLGGDVLAFTGIKGAHLQNLRRELAIFEIYSKALSRVMSAESMQSSPVVRMPVAELKSRLMSYEPSTEQGILSQFNQDSKQVVLRAVAELKNEALHTYPTLMFDGKISLTGRLEYAGQSWLDQAHGLLLKMLARQLMIGWGSAQQTKLMANSSVSQQAMVSWYAEFKNFGIEMGSFDPRTENAGAGTVAAANLFTRDGNGDESISYREMLQNLGMIMAAGGKTYEQMAAGLAGSNCRRSETDVFSKNWIDESCFYRHLRTHYLTYFSNMPFMSGFLQRQSETQFKSFLQSVMDVARIDENNRDVRLETADLRGLNTMLYFIESLYATHDTNRNGSLSESEIKAAYPKFRSFATDYARTSSADELRDFTSWRGTVAGFSCYSEADLVRESFVYMVYHGRTPQLGDLSLVPCLRGAPLIEFSGEVDRREIINTFKILKAVLGS